MSWQLKRNDTNAKIELPTDFQWVDEFNWSKIAQSAPQYTLTGAIDVQQGTKQAGRPITLSGDWVWVTRGIVSLLQSWCQIPELTMTLTCQDGQEYSVMWRLHDNAIDADPVDYQSPETDDDPYTATFKLMTI